MDWLGKTSFGGGDTGNTKRAFLRPNGIYFLLHLAVGALMTDTAVPTPPIIESTNKTVKIGGKRKIIHSKCCRIDNFNDNCSSKILRSIATCCIIYNHFKTNMTSL